MTKSYFTVGLGLVSLVALLLAVYFFAKDTSISDKVNPDPRNATYVIDRQAVTLKDGISEVEIAPGSAAKIVTKYFGNEVARDFDGDGREDTAFILTQSSGGSGTFFYVVVALNTERGYVGSEAYWLGDRIAPQTTAVDGNIIVVNYVDRNPGESFDVQPSVAKSVWLLLDPHTMQLGVVEQNFTGEADSGKMSLDMKSWNWTSTDYGAGEIVVANNPEKFVLTFNADKSFSAATDCNRVGGQYFLEGESIKFIDMVATEMFCEDSQEQVFGTALSEVENYRFTGKGELLLTLKGGEGRMIFK